MTVAELKARRKRFRELGLCPACGAKPMRGRKHCKRHLLYALAYAAKRAEAEKDD